jgi:hypothetical protein
LRRRISRAALAGLAFILLVILVGPFLVPMPPLEGTRPPQELADEDSQFVEIDGLDVHLQAWP